MRDDATKCWPTAALNETQAALAELRAVADEIIATRGWTRRRYQIVRGSTRRVCDAFCVRSQLVAADAATLLRDACTWRDERGVWTMRDERHDVLVV
jgi:hypothetical protein